MSDLLDSFQGIGNVKSIIDLKANFTNMDSKIFFVKNKFLYRKFFEHNKFSKRDIKNSQKLLIKLCSLNTDIFALPYYYVEDYISYIDMDFYSGGNLGFFLNNECSYVITCTQKLKIAYGIAKGATLLNENSIKHAALSKGNILIDEYYEPHIIGLLYTSQTLVCDDEKDLKDLKILFSDLNKTKENSKVLTDLINYFDTNCVKTTSDLCNIIDSIAQNNEKVDYSEFLDYKNKLLNQRPFSVIHGDPEHVCIAYKNGFVHARELIDASIKCSLIKPCLSEE